MIVNHMYLMNAICMAAERINSESLDFALNLKENECDAMNMKTTMPTTIIIIIIIAICYLLRFVAVSE